MLLHSDPNIQSSSQRPITACEPTGDGGPMDHCVCAGERARTRSRGIRAGGCAARSQAVEAVFQQFRAQYARRQRSDADRENPRVERRDRGAMLPSSTVHSSRNLEATPEVQHPPEDLPAAAPGGGVYPVLRCVGLLAAQGLWKRPFDFPLLQRYGGEREMEVVYSISLGGCYVLPSLYSTPSSGV